MHIKLGEKRSFSLVELVLAVGIVSIGIMAILGLLPTGLKESSNSTAETRAAQMAQAIFATLRSQPFNNVDLYGQKLDLTSPPGTIHLTADADGDISLGENADAIYYLELTFESQVSERAQGIPENIEDEVTLVTLVVKWKPVEQNRLTFVSIIGNLK